MKHLKRLLVVMAAVVMAMALAVPAFAQNVNGEQAASGKGQITVSNAAKGETYTAYMLFEATLGSDGEIAYKGTVPTALTTYFEETSTGSGYVQATKSAFSSITYYTDATKATVSEDVTAFWTGEGMSEGLKTALKTWAGSQSANAGTAVSDGSALYFNNLTYGYYVVTTTQGEQLVSVDSTMPTVQIIDKNTTTPSATKEVEDESYSIGDTITYTATFNTANWYDETVEGVTTNYQIKSYTISDTLPAYLSNVEITSVKVIETPGSAAVEDDPATTDIDESAPAVAEVSKDLSESYTAFTNKQIVIPWVDTDGTTSLYKNGSTIEITYTAKLTSTVNINDENTNTISITPNKDTTGENPFNETWSDDAEIMTYGAALKKTDGTNKLAGAEFTVAGLVVEAVSGESGVYRVVSYDPDSTTASAAMSTNDDGKLYIIGLDKDATLKVTESKAPDGYNKLTGTTDLTPQVLTKAIYETSGERYYDAKGNLVSESSQETTTVTVAKNYTELDANAVEIVNQSGTELPSTGGMGTTILYIIGAVLVIGAGVYLITKRRVRKESNVETTEEK